ncbi:ras association domain-containing protein 5 [Lampris incognitus]|uniref:ras association domain-containing protein 5 n=1 Tax=Lampris incognitus TaxID=2546036 RepID=UPI0024B5F89D|nr:ras association domain-containing protein 5 [Lampris incognitus]
MASASVVGQHPGPHRLDSEPQLLFCRKKSSLPRKSSFEKMMLFRKNSVTAAEVDGGSAAAAPAAGTATLHLPAMSPGRRGDEETAVAGGGMPGEGCAILPAHAPRSAEKAEGRDRVSGGAAERDAAAAGRVRTHTGDYNSNMDSYPNLNVKPRRVSVSRTGVDDMPGSLVDNGHNAAHTRPEVARGRRACLGGNKAAQNSVSRGSGSEGETGRLPLKRLTQGRTGVVKLARTERRRRQAWSIFPQEDPRVQAETGEGHRFDSKPVTQDWCDVCSRQIKTQALRCQSTYPDIAFRLDVYVGGGSSGTCNIFLNGAAKEGEPETSSRSSRSSVKPPNTNPTVSSYRLWLQAVPAAAAASPASEAVMKLAALAVQNEAREDEEGGTKALAEEEVRSKIEAYNSQVSDIGMKLGSDGSYTGFVKVHLRLSRPVTVEAASSEGGSKQTDRRGQPAAASEGQAGAESGQNEKRTSFYLPCGCVTQLHISSTTTAREVIQGLLKKFLVLDNPRKFALYRQTHRDGQDLFQKLPLCERPLLLRLMAGPDPKQLSFVLKENETGEVEWYAFSVPELQNFLVILEKEEAERVRAVEQRYTAYRQKLQQALRQHDP